MYFKIFFVIFLIIKISFYNCNDLISKLNCVGNNQHWGCGPTTIECIPLCKNKNYGGVCPDECIEMCICIEGYLRDINGKCIPEDKCPVINQCNAPNEYFGCEPRKLQCKPLCENIKFKGSCPDECDNVCTCTDGYMRNSEGLCIPEDQCPGALECHRMNEIPGCESNTLKCKPLCENIGYEGDCPDDCENKCTCRDGYLRFGIEYNLNIEHPERCVPETLCPPKCNRPNERFDCEPIQPECKPLCKNIGYKGVCYDNCDFQCTCKTGYFKNSKGVCVLERNCPKVKCARQNEIYACEWARMENKPLCGNNEDDMRYGFAECTMMCTCKPGYLRNGNSLCILAKSCPKIKCSRPNEFYGHECNEMAYKPLCEHHFSVIRRCTNNWKMMCTCKSGHLRNGINSSCIPENECPKKD